MTNFRSDLIEALRKSKTYPIDIQPLILKHCRVGSIQDLFNENTLNEECAKRSYIYYNVLPELRDYGWIKYYDQQLRNMPTVHRVKEREDFFHEGPYGIFLTNKGIIEVKKKFGERYPFLIQLRTILITGIVTGSIAIFVNQYKSQQDIQSQSLVDKRQDSLLKGLGDSLQILKRHK